MQLASCWFLTGIGLAVFVWALWTRKIQISRDWFFAIYFVDVFIHLHLFPTLYLQAPDFVALGVDRPDDQISWYYVLLQFAALVLFEWPFLFLYLRGTRKTAAAMKRKQASGEVVPVSGRAIVVSIVAMTFTLTYLTVAVRYGLLRMPRDSNVIPYLLLGLDRVVYAVLRLFVYSGLFLSSVLLVLALQSRNSTPASRFMLWMGFAVTSSVWLLQALLFSRWEVTFGVIVLIGVVLTQTQWFGHLISKAQRPKLIRIVVVGLIVLFYLMRVTYNFRFNYDESAGANLANLNPFISYEIPYYEDQDFRFRLNGLDLMARITPRALSEGYALGAGWEYAFYTAVGQWIPGVSVAEYKLNPLADTKVYLQYRYTSYRLSDWPNSFLTDLYGNFSFPGFLFAAFLLSQVFLFVNRHLRGPTTYFKYLLALFLISQTMMFENSFSGWVFGMLRPGTAFLLLLVLRPFRIERIVPAKKIVEISSRLRNRAIRLNLRPGTSAQRSIAMKRPSQ